MHFCAFRRKSGGGVHSFLMPQGPWLEEKGPLLLINEQK